MKTTSIPKLKPFQQNVKVGRSRTRSSDSELENCSGGHGSGRQGNGSLSPNTKWRINKTTKNRVGWKSTMSSTSSNPLETHHYCSSYFGSDVIRKESRHPVVTFSDEYALRSGFYIKHQLEEPNNKKAEERSTVMSRGRHFCEVLGNQYCKFCRKERLRKESFDDFHLTNMTDESHQKAGSFTPLSDIVLCKSPAIPQCDSRGLFNRLHELSNCSPVYYINPSEGLDICTEQTISPFSSILVQDAPFFSFGLENGEDKELLQKREEETVHFEKEETPNEMEPNESEEKNQGTTGRMIPSLGIAGAIVLATTSVRKSNTFLPELRLKDVKDKMMRILSRHDNTNIDAFKGTFSLNERKKSSLNRRHIEPPQITVDFAMGIFDPKKRLLHKKITYAAVDPNEFSN